MINKDIIPDKYRYKIVDPMKAFSTIKCGNRVFISSGCAEPQFLTSQFIKYSYCLCDTEVMHLLSLGTTSKCAFMDNDVVRLNAFFIGERSRKAFENGKADYTPAFLSDIPRMIKNKKIKIDTALIQVSPPDKNGLCSYGISVEVVKPVAENSSFIIAQVNPMMPRTYGDSFIHIDNIDVIVPFEEPILEWSPPEPDEVSVKIGRNVAKLIEDGSTIQVGIGKVPNGILRSLVNKKDLGVHTEMFSNGVIDLMEMGVITNRKKNLHEGKVVSSFCMGTKKLYDLVNNNPKFEFYPCDYVSDPYIIAQNARMVSINCAVEIDLTGQVCADSIGKLFISGIGSQPDFVRGARRSEGGKSIIAIPSTAKGGKISRIKATLSPGAGVVTTRGDVQYVITEHGIADLEGKSVRERALALIEIAHPKFRHQLLEEAKSSKFLYLDQTIPPVDYDKPLEKWEMTCILSDGMSINVRPIKPSDERALQKFKYSLSDEDVFMRFMTTGTRFTHNKILPLTVIDYYNHMAIVATTGPPGSEEIVGVARYYNNPKNNIAEVAFTVHEKYRRRKIGTFLLKHLTKIAKEHGIKGFMASILAKNKAMMRLFHKSECVIHSRFNDDLFVLWYYF